MAFCIVSYILGWGEVGVGIVTLTLYIPLSCESVLINTMAKVAFLPFAVSGSMDHGLSPHLQHQHMP